MMAARRSNRCNVEQLPENESLNKMIKIVKSRSEVEGQQKKKSAQGKTVERAEEGMVELPYIDVLPLPQISKSFNQIKMGSIGVGNVPREPGYKNRAPLQLEGRARDLILEALKMLINLTTEDLLNVSEQARQELKKLPTKKRLEKKAVSFVQEPETVTDEEEPEKEDRFTETNGQIDASQLP